MADQQQWDFHRCKRRVRAAGGTPDPGFLRTGLFRFSRHSNYLFDVAPWWIFFAMGAVAARSPLQWTVLGAAMLSLLFVSTTRFTERISLARYPAYADYQATTSAVIAWWPRRAGRLPRRTRSPHASS